MASDTLNPIPETSFYTPVSYPPKTGTSCDADDVARCVATALNRTKCFQSVLGMTADKTSQPPQDATFEGQGTGPLLDGVWRLAANLVLRSQSAGAQIQGAYRLAANAALASTSGATLSGAIKTVDLVLSTASRLVSATTVGLAGSWLVEASSSLGFAAGATLGVLGDGVALVNGSLGHLALWSFGQYSYTEFDSGAEMKMISGSKITGTPKFDDGVETRFGISTALNALGILNLKGNYTLDAAATLTQVAGSIINMQRTRARTTVVIPASTTPTLTTADGNSFFLQAGGAEHLTLGAGVDGDWMEFTTAGGSTSWAIRVSGTPIATLYGGQMYFKAKYWNSQWNWETATNIIAGAPSPPCVVP